MLPDFFLWVFQKNQIFNVFLDCTSRTEILLTTSDTLIFYLNQL